MIINADGHLEGLLFDKYQRIRRNPNYIQFCEKLKFDEYGFENLSTEFDPILRKKAEEIRSRFGLNLLFDPSKQFSKNEITNWAIWHRPITVSFEWREEKPKKFTPIWDEHFIRLKIDCSPDRNVNTILAEVRDFITEAQRLLTDEGVSHTEDVRVHFEKRHRYYKIWDYRKKNIPFAKIAVRLGISEDSAKKEFSKAYRLITGRIYDKNAWRRLFPDRDVKQQDLLVSDIEQSLPHLPQLTSSMNDDPEIAALIIDLRRICERCSDSDCRKHAFQPEWQPCPEIFQYLTEPDG